MCISFSHPSLLCLHSASTPHSIQMVGPRLTCIYNVFVSGSPLRSGALLWLVGTADNVGVVWRSWLAVHSQTSQSGAIAELLPVLPPQRLNETPLHIFFHVFFLICLSFFFSYSPNFFFNSPRWFFDHNILSLMGLCVSTSVCVCVPA